MARFKLNLLRFNDVTPINVTGQNTQGFDLTAEYKTFYEKTMLENSRPKMNFVERGKKQKIVGGKVEWRRWNTFAPALTPLTEAVIPTGSKFGVRKIEAEVDQYGDYTAISDKLELTSFDDIIYGASVEMGSAMGNTRNLLTRNALLEGTNVFYAPTISGGTRSAVTKRQGLDATAIIDANLVAKVATFLKKQRVPKYDGNHWLWFIHPSQSFDLTEDSKWVDVNTYAGAENIFEGEIGRWKGFRFIEDPDVKVFCGEDLAATSRTLTLDGAISAGAATSIGFDGATVAASALKGRKIIVGGNVITVKDNTASAITFDSQTLVAVTDNATIYPGEGGAAGVAIYADIVIGADAYGVVDPEGDAQELIVKGKEYGGPLNQWSTIGYKFYHAAAILYDERIVRVESGSSFSSEDEAN